MPAAIVISRRERLYAFAAVLFVQALITAVLLIGLRIDQNRRHELVKRLITVDLIPLPPEPAPAPAPKPTPAAARKEQPAPPGGLPGPAPAHASPAPRTMVAIRPLAPIAGGGSGTGPTSGVGAGGGTGGQGEGTGEGDGGGADLVQIAGAITSSDYPRDLRERGIGGRVEMLFTVGTSGRVTSCAITRSSGVPELDALTCRLIRQRFVYRPSTDRYGRPIADEVEGEHDWVAGRR